jgi:hypothetical protein
MTVLPDLIGSRPVVWIAGWENFVRRCPDFPTLRTPVGFSRSFRRRYVIRFAAGGKFTPIPKVLASTADMTACGVVPG